VVSVALLFAAAAFQASPSIPQAELCTLVTPRGDVVRVAAMAWSTDGSRLGLVPVAGSAWPREAIAGLRNRADRGREAPPQFVFGDAQGVVFEFGPRLAGRAGRSATLFRKAEDGTGLPLAFGYCERGPAPAAEDAIDTAVQPAAVGANIPAFDPALWPETDCAMLLGDGRQLRIAFDLQGRDGVALTSPGLWGGRRIVADMRWLNGAAGVFDHDGGPTGTAANYGAGTSAAKLIRFQRIGGDAAEGLNGYAICGYPTVVRRAAAQ
jgi:hypothetical protein